MQLILELSRNGLIRVNRAISQQGGERAVVAEPCRLEFTVLERFALECKADIVIRDVVNLLEVLAASASASASASTSTSTSAFSSVPTTAYNGKSQSGTDKGGTSTGSSSLRSLHNDPRITALQDFRVLPIAMREPSPYYVTATSLASLLHKLVLSTLNGAPVALNEHINCLYNTLFAQKSTDSSALKAVNLCDIMKGNNGFEAVEAATYPGLSTPYPMADDIWVRLQGTLPLLRAHASGNGSTTSSNGSANKLNGFKSESETSSKFVINAAAVEGTSHARGYAPDCTIDDVTANATRASVSASRVASVLALNTSYFGNSTGSTVKQNSDSRDEFQEFLDALFSIEKRCQLLQANN